MMVNEITFEDIEEILLRVLSRPKRYFGNVIIKYQDGKIKNIIAEDSFDIVYLRERKIINKNMFIKNGAPNLNDKESSKIISELKLDTTSGIVKESKIKKENESKDKTDTKETK